MVKLSYHNLSCRHKFKDPNTIEVVVMDMTTTEQWTYIISFREVKVSKQETINDQSKPNEGAVVESASDEPVDSETESDKEEVEDD